MLAQFICATIQCSALQWCRIDLFQSPIPFSIANSVESIERGGGCDIWALQERWQEIGATLKRFWECWESFAITISQSAADQNANLGDDRHLAAPTRKCAATPRNRNKCGLRVCDLDIWAGAGSAVRDLGQIHQDSSRSPINNAPSQHSSLSILGEKSLNRKQPWMSPKPSFAIMIKQFLFWN